MICRAVGVLTAVLAAGVPGSFALSKERMVSDAATRALDRATADWAHSSVLCAAYSGRLEDTPLDSPLVETNPNITGSTQEALWGLFNKYAPPPIHQPLQSRLTISYIITECSHR